MSNPVVVEVNRGSVVESRHRGAVAVVDGDNSALLAIGDVATPVFPRSAVKALQALPLIESGAADRYGYNDEDLALACASHSGEPAHVACVADMLAKAGLEASALCCGADWPILDAAACTQSRVGAPSALYNNCSGKHAGFLCVASAMGVDHTGYWRPEHPVQLGVRAVLEDCTAVVLPEERRGIDGCSVPTWAMPLENLAFAFAKFGTGHGLCRARAAAAARLRHACTRKPWHVAGTGRFCTEVMQLLGAKVFVKGGAEGVCCASLPQEGLGIAIKCDDGANRAAEAIMAAVITRFLPLEAAERGALARFLRPVLRNRNGIDIGELRVTAALYPNN
jgi:L-asparaginase II